MALIKTILDSKGQTTSYHKIGLFNVNSYTNTIDINMAGYTSKEYRDIEKEEHKPAENVVCSTAIQLPYVDEDISISAIYESIKLLPEWLDAIDD